MRRKKIIKMNLNRNKYLYKNSIYEESVINNLDRIQPQKKMQPRVGNQPMLRMITIRNKCKVISTKNNDNGTFSDNEIEYCINEAEFVALLLKSKKMSSKLILEIIEILKKSKVNGEK